MSALFDFLIKELDDPSKWESSLYCLRHKKSGKQLWMGSYPFNAARIDTFPEENFFTKDEQKALLKKMTPIKEMFFKNQSSEKEKDILKSWDARKPLAIKNFLLKVLIGMKK